MRKKQKGFTMVELLAVVVILGILLLIAVPSIGNIMNQSKKKTFITNAKRYISVFKTDFLSKQYIVETTGAICTFPKAGSYIAIPLSEIDLDTEDKITPWNYKFRENYSYIVVKNQITSTAPKGSNKTGKLVYYFVGTDKVKNGIDYLVEESKLDNEYVMVSNSGGKKYTKPASQSSSIANPTSSNIGLKIHIEDAAYDYEHKCIRKED